jgi:hypothetical protein
MYLAGRFLYVFLSVGGNFPYLLQLCAAESITRVRIELTNNKLRSLLSIWDEWDWLDLFPLLAR